MSYKHQTRYTYSILYSSRSACIDPKVKRSQVKVAPLWKNVKVPWLLVTMSRIPHTNKRRCYLLPLLAWICMSIRLPMFSSWMTVFIGYCLTVYLTPVDYVFVFLCTFYFYIVISDLLCSTFCLWSIYCLLLQLIINLLPVNHEPFFPLSYYVVRDFLESQSVGFPVIQGNAFVINLFIYLLICIK